MISLFFKSKIHFVKNRFDGNYLTLREDLNKYLIAFSNYNDSCKVRDMVNLHKILKLEDIIFYRQSGFNPLTSQGCVNLQQEIQTVVVIPKITHSMPMNTLLMTETVILEDILKKNRNNNMGLILAYDKYIDNNKNYMFCSKVFEPAIKRM